MARGTTYSIGYQHQINGVNSTLVGATVRFTVKTVEFDDSTDDSTALVTKNVTTGDSSGAATITINPADTGTITPGKYYYDIKVEGVDGSIYKMAEGRFILDGSPTNRTA